MIIIRRRLLGNSSVYTYSDPTVTLTYTDADTEEGSTAVPTCSYEQVKYIDGNPDSTITSGGSLTYSASNYDDEIISFNSSTGEITTKQSNNSSSRKQICTVKATVTLNEKQGSAECDVYQKGDSNGLKMDVLFFNTKTRKHYICDHTKYKSSDWPNTEFIPIGIVAIPESHNRYSDSEKYVGVVALNDATTDLSDPSETSVVWGGGNPDDVPSTTNSDDQHSYFFPLKDPPKESLAYLAYNGYEDEVFDAIKGTYNGKDFFEYPTVGMPSDVYMDENGYSNPLDIETKYSQQTWQAINGKNCQAPSPYYYTESTEETFSLLYNSGSDENYNQCDNFNGDEICFEYLKNMTDTAYYYKGWLEDKNIEGDRQMMLPAMEVCWRYAPEGSAEGCWHLPTPAEFAYVISRANLINDTIEFLNTNYSIEGSKIDFEKIYWTSILANYDKQDYYKYAIAHRRQGFTGFELYTTESSSMGICRPMKKVYVGNKENYFIGYETIPTYSNEDYNCQWGICRYGHLTDEYEWGEDDYISGTVYGVKIKGFNDWGVTRIDVPLFKFDNLRACDNEIWDNPGYTDECVKFGSYESDVEPGWYFVSHVELSCGNGSTKVVRNIEEDDINNDNINSDGWRRVVSTCYKYYNMKNIGNGTGFSNDRYSLYGINYNMYPFRVGFWNYDTGFVLHSPYSRDTNHTNNMPWKYCYEQVYTNIGPTDHLANDSSMSVYFPSFGKINNTDTIIKETRLYTMMEMDIDLDPSKFSDPENPYYYIRITYGTGLDTHTSYIQARGAGSTVGGNRSLIKMALEILYEDGSFEEIMSWECDSGDNAARTYLYDTDNTYIRFNVNSKKLGTVGTLKLIMEEFQIAKKNNNDSSTTYPCIYVSEGNVQVFANLQD